MRRWSANICKSMVDRCTAHLVNSSNSSHIDSRKSIIASSTMSQGSAIGSDNLWDNQPNKAGQGSIATSSKDSIQTMDAGSIRMSWISLPSSLASWRTVGLLTHPDYIYEAKLTSRMLLAAGKKTFNSFLSKAKDKYVQVQQQRVYNQQNPGETSASSRGSGTGTGPTTIAGFTIPAIPAPWQGGLGGKQNHVSNQRPASPRENLRSGALSPENRESVMKDYSTSPTNSRPRYETRNSSDGESIFRSIV